MMHPANHFSLKCLGCGSANVINLLNATDIADEAALRCSKCKSVIGSWGDIRRARVTNGSSRPRVGQGLKA